MPKLETPAGYIAPPKTPEGTYDKEEAKRLYFESKHLNWTDFARSRGWHPAVTRSAFPIRIWRKQKSKIVSKAHVEQFNDLNIEAIPLWKKETLRTLRDLPIMVDEIKSLLDIKVQEHRRAAADAAKEGKPIPVSADELMRLAHVAQVIVLTKHKALLLNEVTIKMAQEPFAPGEGEIQGDESIAGFSPRLIGTNRSLAEIAQEVAIWYDAPPPESSREVNTNELENPEVDESADPSAEVVQSEREQYHEDNGQVDE